jgi:Ala-tRNA(Pro) deacylase
MAMSMERLTVFLRDNHIDYSTITHAPAYTAQQIAASAHIPGKILAKTVILDVDGKFVMVVLPANKRLDLTWFKECSGCKEANLAHEYDFIEEFPDCEAGAMPPFGNLYGMKVYVDKELAKDEEIVFNAGSHSELMKLAYSDFEKLVHPIILGKWH